MNKKHYTTPCTESISIEMETAFMSKASVFDPEGGHDKGVTIDGHDFGNSQDFTGDGWDEDQTTF